MQIKRLWLAVAIVLTACGGKRDETPEPTFRAQVFNPLEACRTKSLNRYARGAECPGALLLFVSRQPSPEELLRGTQAALVAYQYAPVERALRVNGRDQPTLEYQMGAGEKPTMHAFFTAFALPGTSESIEAQCYALGAKVEPKRCAALLDGFVAQGLLRGEWPRGLSGSPPQEAFGFRVGQHLVRLPSSCDQIGPLELDCRDGHVRLFVSDAADKLPRMERVDLDATSDPSLINERPVPCTLEGVPTTCTMRRFRLPYSDEMVSFRGTAVVSGEPLLLSCEVKKSQASPLPGSICSQFFAFEEGALDEPQSLTRQEE